MKYHFHILSIMSILTMMNTQTTSAASFPDIRSHALGEAVEYLTEKGIIQGYDDGTFKPEKSINRAEALKIIFESIGVSASDENLSTTAPFPDVPLDEWFAKYVSKGKKKAIIQGYDDGKYRPNQVVNRVEFIKIAMTALPYYQTSTDHHTVLAQYSDLQKKAWYLPYLSFGKNFEFLDNSIRFKPAADMSRGDAAFIIYRIAKFHEALNCESEECLEDTPENTRIADLIDTFEIDTREVKSFDRAKRRQAEEILTKVLNKSGYADKGFSLEIISQETEDFDGIAVTFTKSRLYYKGVPVFGGEIVLEWEGSGENMDISGDIYDYISIDDVTPKISKENILSLAKKFHAEEYGYASDDYTSTYSHEDVQLTIYPDKKTKTAPLSYIVTFEVISEITGYIPFLPIPPESYSPRIIIDANTGKVYRAGDDIHTYTAHGPGGNEKIGRHEYGDDYPALEASRIRADICRLENKFVKTVDTLLRGVESPVKLAYKFTCERNTAREVNGAYSPMNDAHYYATVTREMYRDWIHKNPLRRKKLTLMVHYRKPEKPRTPLAGAFWDSKQHVLAFGDGNQLSYPYSTDMNVVAHEIGHGFTSYHSNLFYKEMSGAINEAYSDMTAEAMEYYLTGQNDWKIGKNVYKSDRVIRHVDDPDQDGSSIDHTSNYSEEIEVHSGSGIYNRAFYLLGTKTNWNTKKAFEVMTRANQYYWTEDSTFDEGVCGVLRAAGRLKYTDQEKNDIGDAFQEVGANCPPRETLLRRSLNKLENNQEDAKPEETLNEGIFEEGLSFSINSISISNTAASRLSEITIEGQGFPRTMNVRSDDCANISLLHKSGKLFAFTCTLNKVPTLHLDIIDEQTGKTLSSEKKDISEVYKVWISFMRRNNKKIRITASGVNIQNAVMKSPDCEEISILERTEEIIAASCDLPSGTFSGSVTVQVMNGNFSLFEQQLSIQN